MTPSAIQQFLAKDRPNRLNRNILSAKEAFMADRADVALDLARPIILKSWQEAVNSGVDPSVERAPTGLSVDQLEHLLATRVLGRAAQQVLDQYEGIVATTGHVIVLADDGGRILYSVGDSPLRHSLEHVNFQPGGVWTVESVGPNGIGTVLEHGSAELVLGHEHFCERWAPWVCYGAPVRHPETGRMLGVIDITGPAETARLETMGLTVSIASTIEQQLTLEVYRRNQILRDQARVLEQRYPHEVLLTVSPQGTLVDANHAAYARFDLERALEQHQSLAHCMPALWSPLADAVRLGEASLVDLGLPANGGRTQIEYRFHVEPIYVGRENFGAVLIGSARSNDAHQSNGGQNCRQRPPETSADRTRVDEAFCGILGRSDALASAIQRARVAATRAPDDPVMIEGETGTGKELFAQAIHRASSRHGQPFIAVNCGALPRDLAEAELFGYGPGAFTGARKEGQAGCFEQAGQGTVFLDEIDSLPLELQVKFLRVVEQGEVTRLGEHRTRTVSMRVIAASGRRLEPLVRSREFRSDLYHRLNVVGVDLPPLRERAGDVVFLARHFVSEAARRYGLPDPQIQAEAMDALTNYEWPGNVRELMNVCRRLVLNLDGHVVHKADLPPQIRAAAPIDRPVTTQEAEMPHGQLLGHSPGLDQSVLGHPGPQDVKIQVDPIGADTALDPPPASTGPSGLRELTEQVIEETIARNGGNVQAAARALGISRATIYRRRKARQS